MRRDLPKHDGPVQTDEGEEVILAIDPGPVESAWLKWDNNLKKVIACDIEPNDKLFVVITQFIIDHKDIGQIVIEEIACYGMAVGKEVFLTCRWSGRFEQEAFRQDSIVEYLPRRECKINLCQSMKAKDTNIRQALIDRFGVQGTKKNPGPLYGVTNDKLAALAVAVTWCDKNQLLF
jgi:hypothetical protein